MSEKILILGISGFTGKHFTRYIDKNKLTETYEFVGVDSIACGYIGFPTQVIDLTVSSEVDSLLAKEKPNYIINLTGTYNTTDFIQLLKVNVGISQNILESCSSLNLSVKNILFIGSAAEYGSSNTLPINEEQKPEPVNLYGISKLFQTEMALYYFHNRNANVTLARPFNLLGEGLPKLLSVGSFVAQIQKIEETGYISVGNVNAKRDFIDVEDAIDAYWKLLLYGKSGEIYNVCAGSSYSIKEILDLLIKMSGKKIDIVVNDEYMKKNDIPDSFGDNSKLRKLFDWKIQNSLENSLQKMF
jgi:GDP-4-dehydro-6-deoxy-D-mannose reductase